MIIIDDPWAWVDANHLANGGYFQFLPNGRNSEPVAAPPMISRAALARALTFEQAAKSPEIRYQLNARGLVVGDTCKISYWGPNQ